jgi:hypothetical protein
MPVVAVDGKSARGARTGTDRPSSFGNLTELER